MGFKITPHATFELKRRKLDADLILSILQNPQQKFEVRPGRWVYQSQVTDKTTQKTCLVRVFVDVDREIPEIVTAYKTTQISKYWR